MKGNPLNEIERKRERRNIYGNNCSSVCPFEIVGSPLVLKSSKQEQGTNNVERKIETKKREEKEEENTATERKEERKEE